MDNTTTQVKDSSGNPIQRVKNWLVSDPKNLMLGLVFASSLAQPRQGGRNAFQTLLQRGAGTALLGGEMNRNEIAMKNEERDRQLKEQQEANNQSNERVRQELLRKQLEQTGEIAANQRTLEGTIARERNETNLKIAQLDRATQLQVNSLRQSNKDSPFAPIMEILLKAEADRVALSGEPFDMGRVMAPLQQLINQNQPGAQDLGTTPPVGTGTPVVEAPPPLSAAAALSETVSTQPVRSRVSSDENVKAVRAEMEAVSKETDPNKLSKLLREKGHRMTPAAREAIQMRIRSLRGLPAPGSWEEIEASSPRGLL